MSKKQLKKGNKKEKEKERKKEFCTYTPKIKSAMG